MDRKRIDRIRLPESVDGRRKEAGVDGGKTIYSRVMLLAHPETLEVIKNLRLHDGLSAPRVLWLMNDFLPETWILKNLITIKAISISFLLDHTRHTPIGTHARVRGIRVVEQRLQSIEPTWILGDQARYL
jgi:hypothetical protein